MVQGKVVRYRRAVANNDRVVCRQPGSQINGSIGDDVSKDSAALSLRAARVIVLEQSSLRALIGNSSLLYTTTIPTTLVIL